MARRPRPRRITDPEPGPPAWPADQVERRPVSSLIAYARNARTHDREQVAQIAAAIREWGFTVPVLIDEQGTIIAGHGRVLAAQKLELADIPTVVARGWTDAQKRAYVIFDNKVALNAGWDKELLKLEIADLRSMDAASLTGFNAAELKGLAGGEPIEPSATGGAYREQFGVIVICTDAAHQERIFNELQEAGHECRVVVT